MATMNDKRDLSKWAKSEERRQRKQKWVGCNDPMQCFANKVLNAEIVRLRAALERCRAYLSCEYGSDAEDLEQVCAEALEGTPRKRDGNDEHHY